MGVVGAILIARWSLGLLRSTSYILLDKQAPAEILDKIRQCIEGDGISQIDDLHVWSITQILHTLSANLVIHDMPISEGAYIQTRVNEILFHKYGVSHATLQLECEGCTPNLLYCDFAGAHHNQERV